MAVARTKDEQLHKRRRKDILLAAARVFKAKGFHLARTDDICAEAGLSAGTVFRYFETKQHMIEAIAQIELESYQGAWRTLACKSGLEWLGKLTEEGLKDLLRPTEYDLSADSWLELARHEAGRAQLLEFDNQLRTTLTRELKRGQKAGWVRPSLCCAGTANILLAIFTGLQFDTEISGKVDTAATARALADLVSNHLLLPSR